MQSARFECYRERLLDERDSVGILSMPVLDTAESKYDMASQEIRRRAV